jgi:hypothetical protein
LWGWAWAEEFEFDGTQVRATKQRHDDTEHQIH